MRHRDGGRGGELKGATATALLRPALETAVVVAREGQRTTPVVPAPAQLRRYLNFTRLPDPALEVARRVLDDDEAFRGRVAQSTTEDLVGRAGWLFLQRPHGWRDELDALLRQAAAAEMAAKDDRHERGAQRRLAGAEAALARAEATAQASAAEAAGARAALDAAAREREQLDATIRQLEAEVTRQQGERAELLRRLKSTEATVTERTAELRAVRHELRMAQAELAQPDGRAAAVGEEARPEPAAPGVDRAAVAKLAGDASLAADYLRRALGRLQSLAGEPAGDEPAGGTGSDRPSPPAPAPGAGAAGVAPPPRRRPAALPPGVLDDGPEAADHLIRLPGVLALVDGYNIAHAQWHGVGAAELRSRLLHACEELHARIGADIEVVFDGAGDLGVGGSSSRSGVRHRFSAEGVEADDVLLERVEQEPPARPVLVVSSDRRVRDGARQRGANVLGARQFLHLLRR